MIDNKGVKRCLVCSKGLQGRKTRFCSRACQQKDYRAQQAVKLDEAREILAVSRDGPNEPFVFLREHQRRRIKTLFHNCRFWPDTMPEHERKSIRMGPQYWLHRWTRVLKSWGILLEFENVVYLDVENKHEHDMRTDQNYKTLVRSRIASGNEGPRVHKTLMNR